MDTNKTVSPSLTTVVNHCILTKAPGLPKFNYNSITAEYYGNETHCPHICMYSVHVKSCRKKSTLGEFFRKPGRGRGAGL